MSVIQFIRKLLGMETKESKFEFYLDKAGEWRWRRKANNGKIIAASTEGYKNRSYCILNAELSGYIIKDKE